MTFRLTHLHPVQRMRATLGLAVCCSLLTGCAVGPSFSRPTNDLHVAVLQPRADYDRDHTVSETAVPSQWWFMFNDPALNDLESKANVANLDLKVAESRIEQSKALLGITAAESKPGVSADTSYARGGISEHGRFGLLGAPTQASNFWHLGFSASWEIDLWGRIHRAQESASAVLEASVFDREAIRISVSAEIAKVYLQLRGVQTQLDIAQQNKAIAERAVNLAESRVRNGVATRFETTSAKAQLATVDAMIPELAMQRNKLMNALALLLGEPPRTLDQQLQQSATLPALPAQVPVGVSSELAHRRPDILSAEANLHAATANIGVAKADFYPRISLSGGAGIEAFEFHDLNTWDSRFFSIGPTIYLPIFQGGRLKQKLALTEAKQKTAALNYRQTVLNAWHEVDNALDAWAAEQQQHKALLSAYEQNKQALQVAERGYKEGVANYLSVLTAQRNLLTSQTSLNTSMTNATLSLVNLYKALGGGWNPADPNLPTYSNNSEISLSQADSQTAPTQADNTKQ